MKTHIALLAVLSILIANPSKAYDADAAGQLGFLISEGTYIARECGLKINDERFEHLRKEFRVELNDIQPDGKFRTPFITQGVEAREFLHRRRQSMGTIAFCEYAWNSFGPTGLRLVTKRR